MKTEQELENCRESFQRRVVIEQNLETRRMWRMLLMFTEFVLDRRSSMHYPLHSIESDLDIDPRPSRDEK